MHKYAQANLTADDLGLQDSTIEMMELLSHIGTHINQLKPGDLSDSKGLFDPDLWEMSTPFHTRFGSLIARLSEQRLIPLEFIGFTSARHNLYRRT